MCSESGRISFVQDIAAAEAQVRMKYAVSLFICIADGSKMSPKLIEFLQIILSLSLC